MIEILGEFVLNLIVGVVHSRSPKKSPQTWSLIPFADRDDVTPLREKIPVLIQLQLECLRDHFHP